jgi:hypothetical protein
MQFSYGEVFGKCVWYATVKDFRFLAMKKCSVGNGKAKRSGEWFLAIFPTNNEYCNPEAKRALPWLATMKLRATPKTKAASDNKFDNFLAYLGVEKSLNKGEESIDEFLAYLEGGDVV